MSFANQSQNPWTVGNGSKFAHIPKQSIPDPFTCPGHHLPLSFRIGFKKFLFEIKALFTSKNWVRG
jgi:hypothetical protein